MLKTNTIIDSETNTAYKLLHMLGKGAFAIVFEAINTTTNEKFAIKAVNMNKLSEKSLKKLDSEILIHTQLKHERIVKLFKTFTMKNLPTKIKTKETEKTENCDYTFLVLELCYPHSLSDLLKNTKTGRFSKNIVKRLGKQIFEALDYMHTQNIVHRDIKLSNVLVDGDRNIKIADFGLSAYINPGEKKTTICGTPNYIAPEVLTSGKKKDNGEVCSGHSFQADTWSAGIVLYIMLIGSAPFSKSTASEIYKDIRKSPLTFKNEIDTESKDLLLKLLDKNPETRISIKKSLSHKFFREMTTLGAILDLKKYIKNKEIVRVRDIKQDYAVYSIYLMKIRGIGIKMKSGICGVSFDDGTSVFIVPRKDFLGKIEEKGKFYREKEQFIKIASTVEGNRKIIKKEFLDHTDTHNHEKMKTVLYFRKCFYNEDVVYTMHNYTITTRIKRLYEGYLFSHANSVLVFDFADGNVVVHEKNIIVENSELYSKMINALNNLK